MDRGTALLRYPRSVTQVYSEKGQPEVSQDTRGGGRHSLVEAPFVGRAREFRQLMQAPGSRPSRLWAGGSDQWAGRDR